MTNRLRGGFALALAGVMTAGMAGAAFADNLSISGDELDAAGALDLGTVCVGTTSAGSDLGFDLERRGAPNNNTWASGALVQVTGTAAASAGGTVALGSTSVTTPTDWAVTGVTSNRVLDAGTAPVSVTVPSDAPLGPASSLTSWKASGAGHQVAVVERTDSVTVTWEVVSCAPLDSTPPEIGHVLSPAEPDGTNGWYRQDVALDWTVTDEESEVTLDGCEDETFSTDGTHTSTCTATSAGGTSGPVLVTVKRDATAPDVAFTAGPDDGASFWFGDPVPAAACSATDATSGVDGCDVAGGGTSVGQHVLTASATDNAGNLGEASRAYTVKAWTIDGFYRPVAMGTGVVNTVKAGSTVPLKFNVLKGSTPMTAGIGAAFRTAKVGCDSGDLQDPVEELATTGGTALRYDATGGQWVQNWATPSGGKGSCYRVTLTTADGSTVSADFKLK